METTQQPVQTTEVQQCGYSDAQVESVFKEAFSRGAVYGALVVVGCAAVGGVIGWTVAKVTLAMHNRKMKKEEAEKASEE